MTPSDFIGDFYCLTLKKTGGSGNELAYIGDKYLYMKGGDAIFYRFLIDTNTGLTQLFNCTTYDCYTYSKSK